MGNVSGTVYCINQKGDQTNYPSIYSWGCAVCAAGAAAAYYAEKQYTIADCDTAGLIHTDGYSCTWNWNINASSSVDVGSTYTDSTFAYSTIRSEINDDKPPIIKFTYSGGKRGTGTHWVMAYGYTGSGNTFEQILVVDPADGTMKTLQDAVDYSGGAGTTGTMALIKKTAMKS